MGADHFVADPEGLRKGGVKIGELQGSLSNLKDKIYNDVTDMKTQYYVSPESQVMANAIEAKREELERMIAAFGNYDDYGTSTSKVVIENQENIMDAFKTGN